MLGLVKCYKYLKTSYNKSFNNNPSFDNSLKYIYQFYTF